MGNLSSTLEAMHAAEIQAYRNDGVE